MQDSLRKPQQRTDTPLDFLLSLIFPGLQQPQSDLRLPQPPSQPQPAPRNPPGQQQPLSPHRLSLAPGLLPAPCPPRGAGRSARGGQTPGKWFPAYCPIPAHSPAFTQEEKPEPGQDLDLHWRHQTWSRDAHQQHRRLASHSKMSSLSTSTYTFAEQPCLQGLAALRLQQSRFSCRSPMQERNT